MSQDVLHIFHTAVQPCLHRYRYLNSQVLLMMAFLFPCNSSVLKHCISLSLYRFCLTLKPAEII